MRDFEPLINILILNFLFNLKIGALTGPNTVPLIFFSIKLLIKVTESKLIN